MRNVSSVLSVRMFAVLVACWFPFSASAQQSKRSVASERPGLSLHVSQFSEPIEPLLDPMAAAWAKAQLQRVALNRTPRLYDTEPPSEMEIPYIDVRLVRAGSKLLVQLTWPDATQDMAQIAKLPSEPTEGRPHRELTQATDRFFDSAAVMRPKRMPAEGMWPSLQMGDADDPVVIYFWSSARGAARMEAQGRGTTKRTGESFPAQAVYRDGAWHLALQLDAIPTGMPLAFAIWNGSQQDRDGRKYFTPWLKLE
jgi:hypothetical protein